MGSPVTFYAQISMQKLMGRYVTQGYGTWARRSQMEKIDGSGGKANGTTRETLKGNKSGSLDGIRPGILWRMVNSWKPLTWGWG